MSLRSRLHPRAPLGVLAVAALLLAAVSGCRVVPEQDTGKHPAPGHGLSPSTARRTPTGPSDPQRPRAEHDPLAKAERLRREEGPARVPELVRALADGDVLVRGIAVLSLTIENNPSQVLDALAPLVAAPEARESRDAARFVVVEVLRRGTPPAAVGRFPVCDWAEHDRDAAVRSRAAMLCAAAPDADPSLLERLARDADWTVRARLAAALSARRDAPAASAVLNVLAHDVHESVRRAASGPALS